MRKVLKDGKLLLDEMESLRHLVASAGKEPEDRRFCGSVIKNNVLF